MVPKDVAPAPNVFVVPKLVPAVEPNRGFAAALLFPNKDPPVAGVPKLKFGKENYQNVIMCRIERCYFL